MRRSVAVATMVAIAACSDSPANSGVDDPGAPPVTTDLPAPTTIYSLYDLESVWRDQQGTERPLASLSGRPQLISLVYTNCASICPFTVAAIQLVEQKVGDRAGYVLVSLDPANDSPERLAEYAAQRQLSMRWTLLSGPERSVRELAALIGVKYRTVESGEIDHSSTLTILDAKGRILAQFDQPDAVDRAVEVLLRFPDPPANLP